MQYSKKVESITPSITLAITAKANLLKQQGKDVVSFGAGEPDFNTPENIIETAYEAMKAGKTKYTPTSGINELKDAIINKFKADNNLQYNREEIIVSTGAKQCLADVFMAILNPGDEVLVPIPNWVSYPELIKLSDGIPVFVECKEENDYKFTVEDLKKFITNKTKAIVINSPNNPTGTVYNKEELASIAKFCEENDILIISDEIYEKLIYDNKKHISIASLSEDAFNRTVVINGLSKSYAMTGWRLGYAAGPKEIIKLMGTIQSHMTSNPNSIAQYAAIEALNGPQDTVNEMIKEFEERRNFMVSLLDKIEGISYIKPEGAFYVMVNIENFLGKEKNEEIIKNSLDFAKILLEDKMVAVIPGSAFKLDNYIRLSYATSRKNIEEGILRISDFIKTL